MKIKMIQTALYFIGMNFILQSSDSPIMVAREFSPIVTPVKFSNDVSSQFTLEQFQQAVLLNDTATLSRMFETGGSKKAAAILGRDVKMSQVDQNIKDFCNQPMLNAQGKMEMPLRIAVNSNNAKMAEILVLGGAKPNIMLSKKDKPLLLTALKNNNADIVKSLVVAGADLSYQKDGVNLLHVLAGSKNPEIISSVMSGLKASKNLPMLNMQTNASGVTPLHVASQQNNELAMEAFVSAGAHLDIADKNGYTPLLHAIDHGNSDAIRMFASAGANTSMMHENGATPLFFAVQKGNPETLMTLLELQGNIHTVNMPEGKNGWTPLHFAIKNQNREIVNILIASGANINAVDRHGNTPLQLAIKENNIALVKDLLVQGAKTTIKNSQGQTALQLSQELGLPEITSTLQKQASMQQGDKPVLKKLSRSEKANLDTMLRGKTLETAMQPEISSRLNQLAKNSEQQDVTRQLFDAIERGDQPKVTSTLLNKDNLKFINKPEVGEANQWTPLHYAAARNQEGIITALASAGADLNTQDAQGRTALDVAVQEHLSGVINNEGVVKSLVQSGANVNAQNKEGLSALHRAIQENKPELARVLLDHGADTTLVNSKGKTALQLSQQAGSKEMSNMLLYQELPEVVLETAQPAKKSYKSRVNVEKIQNREPFAKKSVTFNLANNKTRIIPSRPDTSVVQQQSLGTVQPIIDAVTPVSTKIVEPAVSTVKPSITSTELVVYDPVQKLQKPLEISQPLVGYVTPKSEYQPMRFIGGRSVGLGSGSSMFPRMNSVDAIMWGMQNALRNNLSTYLPTGVKPGMHSEVKPTLVNRSSSSIKPVH